MLRVKFVSEENDNSNTGRIGVGALFCGRIPLVVGTVSSKYKVQAGQANWFGTGQRSSTSEMAKRSVREGKEDG